MFIFGGGGNSNVQIKGKRKGQQQGWGQINQGGWGQQQGGDGWGQQQQGGDGWGQQGEQQGGGGWGQQGGGGWGQQGGGGWGWQGNNGWGQGMGFMGSQDYWGNNTFGHDWVQEQRKRNEFNIFGPGQQNLDVNEIIGKQIILLEPSSAKQKLQELQQTGEPFEDEEFPPNQNSLSGEYGPQNHWSSIEWNKVSDITENPQIFSGRVEPGDIKQGYLGDCYFLAGLAALAERPDRIFNLFLLQEMNDIKYFSVKLLYKGKWRTIDMDEYVPCMYSKPAFSKSVGDQLWVILLEKAWAKLYTSYKRIQAGYAEEAIHDLTGAPIKHLYFQHSSFDYQEDWKYLVDASIKEYSMVGSTQPGSDTDKSTSGVVQGHAYTILNATHVNVDGELHRVVQCRNPWGKGEFHGKWSDEDQMWNYVSEEQKQRVGFTQDKSDGIFFMSYDDFIVQFRALTIAEIDDDASYLYKSFKDPECNGAYFKVQVFAPGSYSFHLDKTPERIYPDNVQSMYRYPLAHLEIGKLDGGYIEKYQGFQSRRRTLCRRYDLQPGTYIVYARIDFDKDFEDQFQVNLATYSSTACNITLATNEEAVMFSGDENVPWSGEEQQQNQGWNQGGGGNGGWGNEGGNDGWGNEGGNDGWG